MKEIDKVRAVERSVISVNGLSRMTVWAQITTAAI